MASIFTPISLDGQAEYLRRFAACPQKASDYSFVNIWGWAEEYGLEWHFGEHLVWIRQTRPESVCWAPVGPWTDVDWSRCPVFSASGGRYIRVPELLAEIWTGAYGGRVDLAETRDHWDYLYDVRELVDLKGNRFHKKKNLLSQFVKKYDHVYHSMTPDCVEAALDMQLEWLSWRDEESQQTLAAENRAITRVLTGWDSLCGVFGGVIEVEGAQAAYTVAERLSDDTLVIHFEKGHTHFKGIYQAINQMFLASDANGYVFVNREQDLGDPGLRKAKESYNPVGFLRKFEARVR
ncbi:hypothetical protein GGQ74_002776 [Desulfobaculum xiamenense]|uniref:Phosphatidylglycerol lysyltransferase C-terminal domain-containing protein n=1 Tax=Desulfobaculum xiamenense TaxID=995050 RepID=A0A846QRE9_9BACT|nr:phosphatidylglycerol lysyltransferase domain-containing protein [Desulfobaculum xiamenense]NJB69082.1 hypothetical protein [Desulfobaculum xiamenense]